MARRRPAVRCHAHRTDGAPCRGYAIHGATVCRAHGGAAPQVRAAAADNVRRARAARVLAEAVPRYLARVEAERRARRRWVARVLGLDEDDPRAGDGWYYLEATLAAGHDPGGAS